MTGNQNITTTVMQPFRLSGTLKDFTESLTDAQKETARCKVQCPDYSPSCQYLVTKGSKELCLETIRTFTYKLPTPPPVFPENPNTGYTPSP